MTASTTMTIRVRPDVKEKLDRIAADTQRSKSFLAGEAVAAYVERELEIIDGIKRGMTVITLKTLDDLVRLDPVWAGCWRSRQALKCAAVAVRLMHRNEDEHALRDALLLTAAGDDQGPAGKVFLAFKRVPRKNPTFLKTCGSTGQSFGSGLG